MLKGTMEKEWVHTISKAVVHTYHIKMPEDYKMKKLIGNSTVANIHQIKCILKTKVMIKVHEHLKVNSTILRIA